MASHNINYGSISNPSTSGSSFSPTELITRRMTLKDSIQDNLLKIKNNSQKLEKIGSRISDNNVARKKMQEIQNSTNNIIKEMRNLISLFVKLSDDKSQKIQSEKIVADFNLVVKNYLQIEKNLNAKLKKTLLVNVNGDEDDNFESTDDYTQQIQTSGPSRETLQYENELLQDRERRMKRIEVDVIDINQIMNEISSLITEQGESIDSIQNNIENVSHQVQEGTSELRKAESYQNKYRKKVLIILIICLIVALIVTLSIIKS